MSDFDTAALAALAAFGEAATYKPALGPAQPIMVVFDAPYYRLDMDPAAPPVTATESAITLRIADLQSPPKQGDQITARGNNYAVREVQPDGQGMARLMLNNLAP